MSDKGGEAALIITARKTQSMLAEVAKYAQGIGHHGASKYLIWKAGQATSFGGATPIKAELQVQFPYTFRQKDALRPGVTPQQSSRYC